MFKLRSDLVLTIPDEPQTFFRRLHSRASEIAQLADAVAEWAASNGIKARTTSYVNLMLDELIANIATHAYAGREDGCIEVSAEYDGSTVCVTLHDYGPPFDPTQVAPADTGKEMDERELGGLGVHFVRQIADRLSYRRNGDVNEIVFCKADDSKRIGDRPND